MHLLILNTSALQSEFLQRGLRYENIGADRCAPENLHRIWYGQYDGLVVPVVNWESLNLFTLLEHVSALGKIPTLFTARVEPNPNDKARLEKESHIAIVPSHLPFQKITQTLKELVRKRESPSKSERFIQVADLRIDLEKQEVVRGERHMKLRHREFNLLNLLMQHADHVLTRTFILENVWDRNASLLSNTVDVHISRLRRKIDDEFERKRIITVPCKGYKLETK